MRNSTLKRVQLEKKRNRIADAYLLLGTSKSRLRTATHEMAAFFLETPSPQEHPDYAVLDPEALGTHGLKVEHIAHRKEGVESVESLLRFRPSEGRHRIIALFDTDRMGADAQAALLKTAEEPPEGTILILTAQDSALLLPALLSRCRTHRVPALPLEEQLRRATASGLEDSEYAILQAALGDSDSPLEISSTERDALLEHHQAFQAWIEDPTCPMSWLLAPEGGKIAEQRTEGMRRLSAILGWMVQLYPQLSPEASFQIDSFVKLHLDALADLRGQVTPSVVFEDLLGQCQSIVNHYGQKV